MVPYTSIYEATFLKRSFREHPYRTGVWLAPIEKQSIEECLNWMHISDRPEEATLEVCRASLDLAYSQGPEYYNKHFIKILRALKDIGLEISVKNWHDRDNEIFGESENRVLECKKLSCSLPWYYNMSKITVGDTLVKN